MTRTMADSTDATALPLDVDLWAVYLDGRYADYSRAVAIAGHPPIVGITVEPASTYGVVGDGPPDNGSWAEWVGWVQRRRAAGRQPTMYTNASEWAAGRAAFATAGVGQPQWWIADWAGPQTPIPPGAVAVQYQLGPAYDSSYVADYWPGVDPPSAAPMPGTSEGMVPMGVSVQTGIVAVSGVTTAGHLVVCTAPLGKRTDAAAWSFMDLTDAGTLAHVTGLTFIG